MEITSSRSASATGLLAGLQSRQRGNFTARPSVQFVPQPQEQDLQSSSSNARKRERSSSPPADQRKAERFRVTDITFGPVNPDGNRLKPDVTWVEQDNDRMLGPSRAQAMWLVKEGGFDTGSDVWWRPAVHFSKELEAQFQANIGYQHGEITYEDPSSRSKTHFFAHDLRGSSAAIGTRKGPSSEKRSKSSV